MPMTADEALDEVKRLLQDLDLHPSEAMAELKELRKKAPEVEHAIEHLNDHGKLTPEAAIVIEDIQHQSRPTPALRPEYTATNTITPRPTPLAMQKIAVVTQFYTALDNLRTAYPPQSPMGKVLNARINGLTDEKVKKDIQDCLSGSGRPNVLAITKLAPAFNAIGGITVGKIAGNIEANLSGANLENERFKDALGKLNHHVSEVSKAGSNVRTFLSEVVKEAVASLGAKTSGLGTTPTPFKTDLTRK
jgi:hypothetical protein